MPIWYESAAEREPPSPLYFCGISRAMNNIPLHALHERLEAIRLALDFVCNQQSLSETRRSEMLKALTEALLLLRRMAFCMPPHPSTPNDAARLATAVADAQTG
jgi:hypothetical protein